MATPFDHFPAAENSPARPFRTFWQAGYEGADHVNRHQQPLSLNALTGHLDRARDDYALLAQFGMRTARESIGWRLTEIDGKFDFSHIAERARIAQEMGIQVGWTFCHYGWPDDVDLFAPEFVRRFAQFCRAAAEFLAPFTDDIPVYSPINEISFTSWALSSQLFHFKNMSRDDAGEAGKRQLIRATIAGCDAIRTVDPRARILQCDPLIHVVAPIDRPDWAASAAQWRASQFDAYDMLLGRIEPELGGADRYLDLIGINYYHSNQWECGTNARLWWHLANPRRMPLHDLLQELHQRYRRPLVLAETSHVGSGRGVWIREMASEAALAMQHGVDIKGICLYPIIDRPDWEDATHWHKSGLWDVDRDGIDPLARVLSQPYALALTQAQQLTRQLCSTDAPMGRKEISMPTIIVFCHLRWDFVYQRPQQLLSRLAEHYKIAFVEEPIYSDTAPFMEASSPAPNITVYRPHTPNHATGFHDEQIPLLTPLLAKIVPAGENPIVWFYTPMALPLLQSLHPQLVIYDCMDELSAFKNSPKQLLQRENALLSVADIVFTGGPSLHEAKRERHANAYCFPSSVDVVHFEQALDRQNGHPAQAEITGPRLGFYGVIDERFDTHLLSAVADAHPEWQLVLVGPILKIDPLSLPQRSNIHYLGQHPYQALPHFLSGWDVCLLPFALNDATRFISPTKVLEYMAAELPIVSTNITDVAQPYGDIVAIAHNAASFIAACEQALAMTPEERAVMKEKQRAILAGTSWHATTRQMRALLESTPPRPQASLSAPPVRSTGTTPDAIGNGTANINPLRPKSATQSYPCVIIGAGPTGLSAAYHYGKGSIVLDKNATVGGWCRSIQDGGYTFDYAGHIMFSNDPYVLKMYDKLLGDNLHWQMREAWVYSKDVYTRYPFQGALFGLPPTVITECIVGAIEARFGDVKQTPGALPNAACANDKPVDDCCADGAVEVAAARPVISKPTSLAMQNGVSASATSTALKSGKPTIGENFESFIHRVWGAGIAKHFAVPYNKKLWTVPLADMETSWLGGRVPLPDLTEIIDGALQPVGKPMGPNARFGYPLKGGFQALMQGFLPHLEGKIEHAAEVAQVIPSEHIVALTDGRRFQYDNLISTMPLPELIKVIGVEAPEEVRMAAADLTHISIRCVNLGIRREALTDKHWIYYPEESIFHRIFVQGNASPECNAPGGFGITCEISYSPFKPLPVDGEALIERCIADCIKVGMFNAEDIVDVANQVDMPYAYVVYDHRRAQNVATVKAWLAQHEIVLAGRYSEWEYYNSDHAFIAGKKAAEALLLQSSKRRDVAPNRP